jgi:hypothetical protein
MGGLLKSYKQGRSGPSWGGEEGDAPTLCCRRVGPSILLGAPQWVELL